jgi:hypothetical protein
MGAKKFTLFLTCFIFLQSCLAAEFAATVAPTLINSSVLSEFQLNITNLGTSNITQINLTLPPSFSFAYCEGCSQEGSVLSWSREIQAGTSSTFIFRVRADVNGTYKFSVVVLDSTNNVSQAFTNTFEVNDTKPPEWSNVWPGSTNVTYSPAATYYFNITWKDNIALGKILFFFGNDVYPFDAVGNVYSTTLKDLKAGSYVYYWYANDTNGNSAQTPAFIFNVTKAPNPLNIYLNFKLNQNISITNETPLTISLTALHGNLTIYQTGPENTTTRIYEPVSMNLTFYLKLGLHNFTFVNTGNENYTSNSSTYFVLVTPTYTTSTSLPTTYSPSTSTFTITFSSAPDLDKVLIEGDWSGEVRRYVMTNSSLTTYSYSTILPAGNFYWQVYGEKLGYPFALTPRNSFSVTKAKPSIYINASPSWIVQSGVQTSVKCTSIVPVKLYRNSTQVSNPDVQTLQPGTYLYFCESEETQNYTSSGEYAILTVTEQPFADLAFIQVPNLILVEQNSSNYTQVVVKNTGNIQQTVNFTIENISVGSWLINPKSISLSPGSNGTFYINFTITNESIGNYTGIFKAYSANKTILSSFTLKIVFGKESKRNVNRTIEGYKLELIALETELNNSKDMGFNVSSAEEMLKNAKQLLSQAETYVEEGNYEDAIKILNSISNLPNDIRKELEKLKAGKGPPNLLIYVAIGVAVGIGALLAYLLWPTEVPQAKVAMQQKESFVQKIKSLFSRKEK